MDTEVFSNLASRYAIDGDSGNEHLFACWGDSVQANQVWLGRNPATELSFVGSTGRPTSYDLVALCNLIVDFD